jgi:RepB DNA-primase from phage plasmid/Primase C terminal 2 (PriCT-2)
MSDIRQSAPNQNITIRLDEAACFLERLDPGARYFTFQVFDDDADRKDERLAKVLTGTLAQHADALIRFNKAGAGIFVTVNETDGRGRKIENIERVRAVFVDLDGAPLTPIMQDRLPPHIIVESSRGRWHVFWLVHGVPREDFAAVQIALIERFNSDPKIHDLPRVMRLPGFFHHKTTVPFRSRLISIHDAEPYPSRCFARAEIQLHISSEKSEAGALELWMVGEALKVIPTSKEWEDRNYIGMAAWRATDGHDYGFKAWAAWLERSGQFNVEKAWARWCHYSRSPPTELGIGTLIYYARLVEPGWYERVMEELDDVMGGCDA